jgi:ankyrin repeat protein
MKKFFHVMYAPFFTLHIAALYTMDLPTALTDLRTALDDLTLQLQTSVPSEKKRDWQQLPDSLKKYDEKALKGLAAKYPGKSLVDKDGNTLLTTAFKKGYHNLVVEFLDNLEKYNIEINQGDYANGHTLLRMAIQQNNPRLDFIEKILDKGGEDFADRFDETGLHFALENFDKPIYRQIAQLLVDKRNPAFDKGNRHPYIDEGGYTLYLIEAVTPENQDVSTIGWPTRLKPFAKDVVEFLVKNGANKSITDTKRNTPLWYAIQYQIDNPGQDNIDAIIDLLKGS